MIHKQTHQKPVISAEVEPVIQRAAQLFHTNMPPTSKDRRYARVPHSVADVPPAKIAELADLREGGPVEKAEYGLRRGLGMVGLSRTTRVVTPDVIDRVVSFDPSALPPEPNSVSHAVNPARIEFREDNLPPI